jgi:quinolinate synthase
MQNYIEDHPEQKQFFLVTECGLSDRFTIEYPDREFYGACSLCPYMKEVMLKNILESLKNPSAEQIVELDPDIMDRAKGSLDEMLKY